MRKLTFISMLALLVLLMTGSIAMAADQPYYHGDFATDTTGCAKCHVTHAGDAAALLIAGPTQTDFCYYCHDNLLASPYDVYTGQIATSTGVMPSIAGGFDRTYDFDTKTYDETGGGVDTNYLSVSSVHGVETLDNDDWTDGSLIPGGTNNLTGNFRCGSCHDPHAGGTYPAAGVMPRLLKAALPASTEDPANYQDWTFSSIDHAMITGFKTKVLTGYGDYAGVWCAGCHDLFNQTAQGAGQNPVDVNGKDKYMHRMNFTIDNDANGVDAIQNAKLEKVALSVGNKLTCLTCHRAHGTASTVTTGTVWNRAREYKNSIGGTSDTSISTVLLREENRDVCYDCHGAATANRPSDQSS